MATLVSPAMNANPADAKSPLVSILISTYNAAVYLPWVCRSIQAQTYSNFEAIILDDGSTDETTAALAPFVHDARFQLLNWHPNRGVNVAWRKILPMAKGKYWISPGADDVMLPDFIKQRVALMEAHPEAAMVHGAVETIDATGKTIPNPHPQTKWPAQLKGDRALLAILQHNFINQPSTMIRVDVTQTVMPYYLSEWRYAQDWHLWVLILSTGLDLLWDERPLLQYRVHASSSSGNVAMAAIRAAEDRLASLFALKDAAPHSPMAAKTWKRWGPTLYHLWLSRAANLRLKGALRDEWLQGAGKKYYGESDSPIRLWAEILRHGPGIFRAGQKQRRVIDKQIFQVAGIAEIDDPLFRKDALSRGAV